MVPLQFTDLFRLINFGTFSYDRSASLAHVNSMLREQLDQATAANQSLTADIHKLTQEWQRAREELDHKEAEWREEEQVNNLDCTSLYIPYGTELDAGLLIGHMVGSAYILILSVAV